MALGFITPGLENWDWSFQKLGFTNFGNKKIQYSGYGSWTLVSTKQRWRWGVPEVHVVSMEDTSVRNVAPRMSCAVLAAAAW